MTGCQGLHNLYRCNVLKSLQQPRSFRRGHVTQLSMRTVTLAAAAGVAPVSHEEEEANKKRWEESGQSQGSSDEWRWTLNWNEINDKIIVGSCPRSAEDVDRLVDEAKIGAIICLQSDVCFDALQIDFPAVRLRCISRGVLHTRVAVRDFDHNDQALMLPEAVRMLYALLLLGKRVYVHCTAGINRATLTVVGYMTFVQGMRLADATALVKEKRPQAHPYIDCWTTVRKRMLEPRATELAELARSVHASRKARDDVPGDDKSDWRTAERMLLQELFQRQVGCTLSLVSALQETQDLEALREMCSVEGRVDHAKFAALQASSEADRFSLLQVQEELRRAKEELYQLRHCYESDGGSIDGADECALDVMDEARTEIAQLRAVIQTVNDEAKQMLSDS